jgi:hypothetical protein
MKITICGAGNAAQTLIALLAADNQTDVAVYAPLADEAVRLGQAAQINGVTATFPGGKPYCGRPALVTADAAAAGTDASLVLLALPAFAHEAVLRALAPPSAGECLDRRIAGARRLRPAGAAGVGPFAGKRCVRVVWPADAALGLPHPRVGPRRRCAGRQSRSRRGRLASHARRRSDRHLVQSDPRAARADRQFPGADARQYGADHPPGHHVWVVSPLGGGAIPRCADSALLRRRRRRNRRRAGNDERGSAGSTRRHRTSSTGT